MFYYNKSIIPTIRFTAFSLVILFLATVTFTCSALTPPSDIQFIISRTESFRFIPLCLLIRFSQNHSIFNTLNIIHHNKFVQIMIQRRVISKANRRQPSRDLVAFCRGKRRQLAISKSKNPRGLWGLSRRGFAEI